MQQIRINGFRICETLQGRQRVLTCHTSCVRLETGTSHLMCPLKGHQCSFLGPWGLMLSSSWCLRCFYCHWRLTTRAQANLVHLLLFCPSFCCQQYLHKIFCLEKEKERREGNRKGRRERRKEGNGERKERGRQGRREEFFWTLELLLGPWATTQAWDVAWKRAFLTHLLLKGEWRKDLGERQVQKVVASGYQWPFRVFPEHEISSALKFAFH